MSGFRWLVCRVSKVGGDIASVTLVMLGMLFIVEVVGRKLFGWSTLFEVEGGCYLMLATIFIGAAYTLKTGGHIRITAATERFSQKVQAQLDLFVSVVTVVVSIYMSWYFWQMVIQDYRSMATDLSALSMPLWIPKSVMAVGFSLLALQFVADIIGSLGKTKVSIPPGIGDNEKPKRRLKR